MIRLLKPKPDVVKKLLFAALFFLALSVVLAVAGLYALRSADTESYTLINYSFRLSPREIRRENLGSFYGGENISISVQTLTAFPKNFSIETYNGTTFSLYTDKEIAYTFTAGADYYEAVFFSNSSSSGQIHFEVAVEKPHVSFPFSYLSTPAKIMFYLSLGVAVLILLKSAYSQSALSTRQFAARLPSLSKKNKQRLVVLLLVSLIFWLLLLAINTNSLATYENWYTDHARHSYTSALFAKVGFSVFDKPLGELASVDSSFFKFVTWPEMPHLYPLGSIFLFLPFGFALQNGFAAILVYKFEIAVFLVIAHLCFYLFLKNFFRKDLELGFKLAGVYVLFVPLVVFAANGMFDSIAFLFSLTGLLMFMEERYDYFFLFISASILFKYQAGIFLFPLILLGALKLFEKYKLKGLLKNKAVVSGVVLVAVSFFTASLSAPFLLQVRPQFNMNGINAFSPNAQVPWVLQAFSVLLTLGVTVAFVLYMFKRNSLLSLSALFLLLPSFTLPYFQIWYLPFVFVYVLIPQKKRELQVTMVWLIFVLVMLSSGGIVYNPLTLLNNLLSIVRNFAGFLVLAV